MSMDAFSLLTEGQFAGRVIQSAAGVRVRVLGNGCVQTLEVGPTMVNLFVGQPMGGSVGRLYVRRVEERKVAGWCAVVGPEARGEVSSDGRVVRWRGVWREQKVRYEVTLSLHASVTAWAWTVRLWGEDGVIPGVGDYDAVLVQDVGIAGRGQIQNNEAYTSQYIDQHVMEDARVGDVVASRQNLAQDGRHPWVMHACVNGAAGIATDGQAFFGSAYRATGVPALLGEADWGCVARQGELACHALVSKPVAMDSEADAAPRIVRFVGRFVEDHPNATGKEDVELLGDLLGEDAWRDDAMGEDGGAFTERSSVTGSIVLSGQEPSDDELHAWFGERRDHEERLGGQAASFFDAEGRHVVTRAKEQGVLRRHGHILMGGDAARLPNEAVLCSTAYACGVFASHVCLGNTSFNKLLSVSRDALNVVRDSGLRAYVREGDVWRPLGVASAFAMGVDEARWVYRLEDGRVEVTCRVATDVDGGAELRFGLRMEEGPARAFLLTAQVVLGDRENEHAGRVEIDAAAGVCRLVPSVASMLGRAYPAAAFEWRVESAAHIAAWGGDELLFEDGRRRGYPVVVLATKATDSLAWTLSGDLGVSAQDDAGDELRQSIRIESREDRPEVSRLSAVLPWFEHNAAIHLTAPHGIEQYGGAAWGVRDVCQGPIEWLIARGEHHAAAAILRDVFAHQYAERGDWPQWYMHPPYQSIQSAHCHGDVAVWPLLATAQYLEASGDFALLDQAAPYTDDSSFAFTVHPEPIRAHLRKTIDTLRRQFIPGTSLLRYGEGDWNDSLQPVSAEQRERMVSTWTVMLMHHALRLLAPALQRAGDREFAEELSALADAVRRDIQARLIVDGETVGLYLHHDDPAQARPLLHPRDSATGIHHRLLPMTRGILSETFTPEQARHHLGLIREHLLAPDGARLFDRPPRYHGGLSTHFQRAESAAYFGREIGVMYVHAHLRYAQAMAHLGEADALLDALLTVNPVAITASVSHALPRQANAYFSSSDADVATRYEAERLYEQLKRGRAPVYGGWRVYSSGPGIYVGLVVRHLLGIRRSFDQLVIDPVLPAGLGVAPGLRAAVGLCGHAVRVTYTHTGQPSATLNQTPLTPTGHAPNAYRRGGPTYALAEVVRLLAPMPGANHLAVTY